MPPFYLAIKTENVEIIQLLLKNEKLDVNAPYISNKNILIG